MDVKMNKAGQVTIWIILAVILIAVVLLFLALDEEQIPLIATQGAPGFAPETFIQTCVEEYVEDATRVMLPQGGFISPKNTVGYNGTEVEYLCENIGFYEPCINQHPVLLKEISQQIEDHVDSEIGNCFNELETVIENRQGDISFGFGHEIDVRLGEDRIFVDIEKDITITEREDRRVFGGFSFEITNPIYNLATIALEIAAQEADYCYFEFVGYGLVYPRYKIIPYYMSDPTVIYTIIDTRLDKQMSIAIRSCAIPAGI